MHKEKRYHRVCFQPEVINKATEELDHQFNTSKDKISWPTLTVEVDGVGWSHDTPEEFFADYRRSNSVRVYNARLPKASLNISITWPYTDPVVTVTGDDRSKIEAVFEVFEAAVPACKLPEPPTPPPTPKPKPVIFIGHGRSPLWRDLKDHLQDKHGYQVEAYEIGARAGHAIRDILEDMLKKSSFALLVMTGEDESADGTVRARQNVIHETGLFQGRLGFSKALVLLEEGTDEFSNIHGIDQIRFGKGNIKETVGEVLATLRREFGTEAAEP